MSGAKIVKLNADLSRQLNIGGGPPSGPAGGDTSGTFPNPTNTGIGGVPIDDLPPTTTSEVIVFNSSTGHWEVRVLAAADVTGVLSNPMTAQDDIIVGGVPSGGIAPPGRLAKGSDGQVLTVDPTTHHLLWAAPAGGMTNPMTTVGDVIVGGTVTGGVAAPARLGVGSANQLLHGGTTPAYSAVLPADMDVTADNTTADATTGHHGLLPKLGGGTTNFLRADGSWQAPPGGAAGALVLLGTGTASSSASLDFTSLISSTYDVYMMTFQDVMPATNQACPMLRYSTDNGATWVSTSSYGWKIQHQAGSTSRTDSGLILFGDSTAKGLYNAGSYPFNCDLYLFNPLGTTYPKQVKWIGNALYYDGSNWYIFHGGGYMAPTTTAINAIQFLMSSGNIASGIVRLYGITK